MDAVPTPTASYSFTIRTRIRNRPGMLGKVAAAIGDAGGNIGAIDLVEIGKDFLVRDISVAAGSEEHSHRIVETVRGVEGIHVVSVSDRTFLLHLGGKIEIRNKVPLKTRDDLSMAYTPGVARVCMAIHRDPAKAFRLTIKRNTIAVVTDGSAVLGLGNIGPEAALPVMEGKAMLFKEFAGVDAFPICLATQDVRGIVEAVTAIAPVFGGINLEDISAPRCFEVEARLKEALDIPVFHDDQHGTAVVVLAALLNALKIVRKSLEEIKVVIAGAGAAGISTTKILLSMGVRRLLACDRKGIIYPRRRADMNPMKRWLAQATNPEECKGTIADALEGADVFIGLSGPRLLKPEDLTRMARDPIIFAMANPDPEIMPEEAAPHVRVMATGRSDYPNQINNVLCFPGLFRGILDCRAREINEEMKLAAARAIASVVSEKELQEDYIIPSVFNKKVVDAVARAVARAAVATGVARRERRAWK